jgi:2-polyprenyl-6-hydroxyphenyl methylase/3-demethylubiquinone-9 3-methyltransferase
MSDAAPNYAYWQSNGQIWVNEYQRRRTTTALYGLQEILLSTIVDANAPARVLEFGCGVGRHLAYLSQIPGVDVHGIDQSPTMLAGVSRFVKDEATISHTQLIEPLGRLPLGNREFDIVFTAEVLVHVRPADLEGRLAELVRVCRGSLLHFEPAADYVLVSGEHNGCWNHDLVAAYARLGLVARLGGRPIQAQELVVVDLDPSRPLRVPSAAVLKHVLEVEDCLQLGIDRASSITTQVGAPVEPALPQQSPVIATLADRIVELAPASPVTVEAVLEALPEAYRDKVASRRVQLKEWRDRGFLTSDMLCGKWVLDWECGDCAFAVAMLLEGARCVIAADSWLDEQGVPAALRALAGLVVVKLDIFGVSAVLTKVGTQLDLVFANTVTEHISDLTGAFRDIRRALRPGGLFFSNHDNYFQPVGSHDHGFLFYGPNLEIVFQGVRCWEQSEKCAASAEHREHIARDYPWTWSPNLERTRNSIACDRCFYFRRAQPWAHLLYQPEFREYFGNETFSTGQPRSGLNKITLFQLKQLVIEAGFKIVGFERTFVANEPPAALLGMPHFLSREDLRTCTAILLAQAS